MGIGPQGKALINRNAYRVGHCLFCPNAIFSDTGHVRVRRPSIGLCHTECVPKDAVVVAEVEAK